MTLDDDEGVLRLPEQGEESETGVAPPESASPAPEPTPDQPDAPDEPDEPGEPDAPPPPTITRRGVAKNLVVAAIFLVFTLVVGVAFAYFGGTSVPGGNGASAATTVNQGATPTVVTPTDGSATVSWAASTLATGQAVSGYRIARYDAATLIPQTVLSGCDGTTLATTCIENGLSTGQWRYSVTPVFSTNWLGQESVKSAVVSTTEKDVTPPVNALTATAVSGSIYADPASRTSGIYYRGSVAGSLTIRNALTDAASGPASSTTSALTGTTTGWSHTPSTVTAPSGGPYVSNPFSWSAGSTGTTTESVVGKDVKANAATSSMTFTNDSTAPTATVSYGNTYETGLSVAVTFTASDSGSGLAGRQLQRSSAPLSLGVCGTFGAFARIGPANPTSPYADTQVANATCYQYRYVVLDNVGNQTTATNANVTKVDYAGAVNATTGLLSQWRLGEKLAIADTFTGTTGTLLSSRTGETGATWTRFVNDTGSAVIDGNALRRDTVGGVSYLASGVPPVADYQVAADVVVKSYVAADYAGLVGRSVASDTTGQGTKYNARYNSDGRTWELLKIVGGTGTVLGTYAQTLTVGQPYRLSLDMRGSSIRLLVDGVQRVSATDTAIPGAGLAGVRLGAGTTGAASTATTGLRLDNVKVTPRALDGKGSNNGTYVNQPVLGVPGAIAGDPDTATAFDGTRDAMQVANTVGVPVGASVRSVEGWFKTTSTARQTILSYGAAAGGQEFGVMITGGNTAYAWGLASDLSFPLPYAVNDGAWHQLVNTYDGTSITVFLDGVALTPQAVSRNTGLDSYGIGIGAVLVPGDSYSGSYFVGVLDDVSFYTSVLNQATVTSHYLLGTSPSPDQTGPTGGSVDATGLVGTGSRYSTSTTLSIRLAKGTDPSGVSPTGAELQRASATLTSAGGTANGSCGSYGAYAVVPGGTDPDTPKADTVADQTCYSYHYVVSDTLGNQTTYASPDVKVETTGPTTPTLAYSATTNVYSAGAGAKTLYYRSSASSGSFTVTASATDAQTGVLSYAFPDLGAGWTSTAGARGVTTYSWSGTPAAPGGASVTATNNATVVSAGAALALTPDNTAPAGGTVSYPAISHSTSVAVTFSAGTDTGSGISSTLLQRASATLTGATCGTFGAFGTVTGGTNPTSPLTDTVAPGNCYKYQLVVTDNVGNSAAVSSDTVLQVTGSYASTISGTAGLVNYWRLDEQPDAPDTFTDTAGTTLSAHTADAGFSWTSYLSTTVTGVVSNANRLRKSAVSGGVGYYTSQVPPSADYLVSADLNVKTLAANNDVGVIGRADVNATGTGTYYLLRYDTTALSWQLIRNVNGTAALLASYAQTLTVGATYNAGLDLNGSTVRMLIDGTERANVNDATITAVGRAGVALGAPGDSAVQSDSDGLHLDNFALTPALLVDGQGTASGTYANAPTLRVPGAVNGDRDTAVTFDGVNEYGTVPRQVSDDLSIEFYFKSTQGIGTGSQWWEGAGLVDAEVAGSANDFGVTLRADGRVVAGVGPQDTSIISSTSGLNDGRWHHVVFTRVLASGAMRLYTDGTLVGSATGPTNSLTSSPVLSFGRLASGLNAYAGSLDEVSVYNVALSATTVAAHYTAGQ